MHRFVLLMWCVMEKCVFSISFVWTSKFLQMNFLSIRFGFWFSWCDTYFNSFFAHCNCRECKTLVVFHIYSNRKFDFGMTHRRAHTTHIHAYVYVVSVWGYERFNLSTMTFHSQSHISNVMCQKINNPYIFRM